MAETLLLPLRQGPANFTVSTKLGGRTFAFAFEWNYRAGAWFMGIDDADGVSLLRGKKLTTGASLNTSLIGVSMFGVLGVLDTTGAGGSPGIDDLGTRFLLMYSDDF